MTSRISQQSGFSLQLIFKNLLRRDEATVMPEYMMPALALPQA